MNENDKKIRKQWLIMIGLSIIGTVITSLLQFLLGPALNLPFMVRCIGVVFSLAGCLLSGFVCYYCAYKKQGTKWLTFILVSSAISFVAVPILYFSGAMKPPAYIPYYPVYFLVTQAMGVWWFILSWKMRKINKRLKKLAFESLVI